MSDNWISRYLRERAREEAPHPGAMNPDLLDAARDVDDLVRALRAWIESTSRIHETGSMRPVYDLAVDVVARVSEIK